MTTRLKGRVRSLVTDSTGAHLCVLYAGGESAAELHDLQGTPPRPPRSVPNVKAAAFVWPAHEDMSSMGIGSGQLFATLGL
eukprot:628982-Prymnesium_polylepis.1